MLSGDVGAVAADEEAGDEVDEHFGCDINNGVEVLAEAGVEVYGDGSEDSDEYERGENFP